jgi:hypothetical protein
LDESVEEGVVVCASAACDVNTPTIAAAASTDRMNDI